MASSDAREGLKNFYSFLSNSSGQSIAGLRTFCRCSIQTMYHCYSRIRGAGRLWQATILEKVYPVACGKTRHNARTASMRRRESKMASRWPHDGPKMGPTWPQHNPTWPQDGPRFAQMAPRWPKMAPDVSRKAQNGPKMAQNCPKWVEFNPHASSTFCMFHRHGGGFCRRPLDKRKKQKNDNHIECTIKIYGSPESILSLPIRIA